MQRDEVMQSSVVVTGGGMGIGRAIVDRLSGDGYYVVTIERDAGAAADVERSLGRSGAVIVSDTADREVHSKAADLAARRHPLWAWVNNASVVAQSNLHEPNPEVVDRIFAVNIGGYYWGAAAAIQTFVRQRSQGVIVNISSVHGRAGYSNHAAYDASKGAVDALTRYIAVEYGQVGIRANAIAPGAVLTPGAQRSIDASPDPAQTLRDIIRQNPARRIAPPAEIAGVAAFLISDAAAFITGESIAVDGGLTATCMQFELDPKLYAQYHLDRASDRGVGRESE